MNKRILSLIGFAFLLSAGTSLLLYRLVLARGSAKNKAPAPLVVVAARTLEIGTLIKDIDLTLAPYSGQVRQGMARKKEEIVGRGVVARILEGEPIQDARLAARGAGGGLAAIIPQGMRAVAVRVNDVVGVSGFVLPGMRVDVIIAGRPPTERSAGAGTVSRTLLQNVEVLSAGQQLQKETEGKPVAAQVVNLLVTPAQAEMLSLAGNETRIQLVLRNPLDTEVSKPPGSALAALFTGSPGDPPERPATRVPSLPRAPAPTAAAPPPTPAQAPFVVEMLHGTKKTEARFF